MSDIKISIGQVVHYQTGSGETFAAIVASVDAEYPDDRPITLCVFNPHISGAPIYTVATQVEPGSKQAGWFWPPRI